MSWAASVLTGLAVLLVLGRGDAAARRRVRRLGGPVSTAGARSSGTRNAGRWPDGSELRVRRSREGGDGRHPARADLLTVVVAVSASLRAGSDPSRAWHEAVGVRPEADGAPSEAEVLDMVAGGGRGWGWASHDPALVRSVSAVVGATRLAVRLGAPLAAVLDRCAAAVEADEETAAELAAAVAGPRQTASLLGWLPAVGLLLGVLLGADPVAVLTDGRWGTACGVTGAVLTVLGRLWVRQMVAAARAAGGLD